MSNRIYGDGKSDVVTTAGAASHTREPGRVKTATSNDDIAPCLSVVMAVYNEESTVIEVLRSVLHQRPVEEVIVIDDASADGTWKILEQFAASEPRVKLHRHKTNKGKGAAIRTGFEQAGAPIVIIQDADLEYDPREYFLLLNPILTGRADVVYGSRFGSHGAHRVLYYWHSVGNRILTTLSNMGTNLNLADMETCYKAFRREVLQRISVEESRFGFEPEITAKVARLGVRIYEVPISYYGRTYQEGKKISWKDGVSALRCIFKYNFFR
jgi:glycosyltransferase involved in cell wall biosynthesis